MTDQQLFINGIEIDLSPDEVVAISSQINTLSELRDHQSNLSNRFKVPKTKNNIAALQQSDQVSSGTVLPYRKNGARLIKGGLELIGNGYAVIESASDRYYITVYSGNTDFFSVIDKLKLSDLDLSALDHVFEFDEVIDSIPYDESDGYKYPIVDYGQLDNVTRTIDPRFLRVFYFVAYLFKKVFTDNGFTYSGDFFTNTKFLNLMISGGNNNFKDQYYDKLQCIAYGERFDLSSSPPPYNYNFATLENTENYLITVRMKFNITSWINATSLFGTSYFGAVYSHTDADGTGSFDVTFTNAITGPTTDGFYIDMIQVVGEFIGGEVTIQRAGVNTPDVFIGIAPFVFNAPGTSQMWIAFSLEAQYGFTTITTSKEVPALTQKEFIKSVGHIFGLMFRTDSRRNKIYIKQFSEIVANIPDAVDWSDKLHVRESPNIEFRIGSYAQKNHCKYADDSSDLLITDGYGNGMIMVDDNTLPAETDIIKLPFAATIHNRRLLNLTVPQIKRIDDDTGEYSIKTVPRLLYDQVETISGDPVIYDDGFNTPSSTNDIPLPWFVREDKSNNLSFDNTILNENYSGLTNVLNKGKRVVAEFKLNATDVYKFTEGNPETEGHFIPVFISQFGAYFYVSKIINYTGKGLTKVELIRIGERDLSIIDACFNEFYPGILDTGSDTGYTYDAAFYLFLPGYIQFDATGGAGDHVLKYPSFTHLKTNKCYKLVIDFDNGTGNVCDTIIRINGGEYIFTYSMPATVETYVSPSFNIASYTGEFLTIQIDDPLFGSTVLITAIRIVSCDCTEYD